MAECPCCVCFTASAATGEVVAIDCCEEDVVAPTMCPTLWEFSPNCPEGAGVATASDNGVERPKSLLPLGGGQMPSTSRAESRMNL